jgi:hypothetical protein
MKVSGVFEKVAYLISGQCGPPSPQALLIKEVETFSVHIVRLEIKNECFGIMNESTYLHFK